MQPQVLLQHCGVLTHILTSLTCSADTVRIAKFGAVVKDAGCKQYVYLWATYVKAAFPPLVTGRESTVPEKRHGWDDC